MSSYQQMIAMEEEYMMCGDARKCPHHPHVKTSSDDGMFDAPCYECEALMYEAREENRSTMDMAREWVAINKPELEGEEFDIAVEQCAMDIEREYQERANRDREQDELNAAYAADEDNIPF